MNLGQTMITMGMFMLLIMSVISANRMLVQNAESGFETEALTESATIANDVFQEAQSKKFDAWADETGLQLVSVFTRPDSLGPSNTERGLVGSLPDSSYLGQYRSINAYDDADDYNGYTRIVNADSTGGIRISGFDVKVRVFYVDPSNPDDSVSVRTFVKRIEVNVTHKRYFPFKIREIGITYSSLMSY
jgi:hypothetical protein